MTPCLTLLIVCLLAAIASGRRLRYRTSSPVDRLDGSCFFWSSYFVNGGFFTGRTQHGSLCLKYQDTLKILTWCRLGKDHPLPETAEILWRTHPTVVNARESLLYSCKIFDVTLRGEYTGGWCYFMLIEGLLMCVDEENYNPEYGILTIYPTVQHHQPAVDYKICSVSLGSVCPGPARLPTVAAPEEEITELDAGTAGFFPPVGWRPVYP